MASARPSLGGRASMIHRRKEVYQFPILKNSEIVEALTELGLDVTEDTLTRCRADALRTVYERLLICCLDMTKEDLAQPKFAGLDSLNHADLHEDSVPALHFLRAMTKLLTAAGVASGFNVRDLVKPDARRTRRNLSAIINFHKFRDERLRAYTGLMDQTSEMITRRDEAVAERDAIRAELEAERARAEAEAPQLQAVGRECTELEASIAALNQQQARMRAEAAELKQAIADAKQRAAAAVYAAAEAKETTEALRGSVVADADGAKAALAHAHAAMEAEKAAMLDADRRCRVANMRADVVRAASREVAKCMAVMADAEAELQRLGRATEATKARAAELEAAAAERADVEAELRQKQRESERLEGRVRDFRPSAQRKQAAAQAALDGMRTQLQATLEAVEETEARAADMREREAAEARRAAEAERERDEALRTVAEARADMLAGLRAYHHRVLAGVRAVAPSTASLTTTALDGAGEDAPSRRSTAPVLPPAGAASTSGVLTPAAASSSSSSAVVANKAAGSAAATSEEGSTPVASRWATADTVVTPRSARRGRPRTPATGALTPGSAMATALGDDEA